jgi:hypothetical protein
VFLGKFDDGNRMPELDTRPLAMTQHQRQGCLQHRLVGNLVSRLGIDSEILPGSVRLFLCVCQELPYLLWVDLLRSGRAHS